ncbi:golgin subfamily A member 6-like protein 22 [Branchiostoma floridae]|uniref:Golgin subfamily A member 6-like protein 22 n=1 Tax=Branchiostoma floridae TaxID=7739 RepID=A0A9J7MUB5_BRAFL|nr:golgin subfamily A member 6-like protein 22 [Branchiostoma floridae]
MWRTAGLGREYRMQLQPYQRDRPVAIPQQPTSENYRLTRENELKRELQQKHDECLSLRADIARVKADLTSVTVDLRRKERETEDWKKQVERHQNAERDIRDERHKLLQKESKLWVWHRKLQGEQNAVGDAAQKLLQSGKYINQLEYKNRILQNDFDEASSLIDALKEELQDKEYGLRNMIMEKETELRHAREDLDEERNNKVGPRHNQGEESEEELSRLQSEKDMLEQKLQEATRELQLRDIHAQRTLQDKNEEIAQLKHELNTSKELLRRKSERASKTEYELRQCEEERDNEAKRAFKDISCLTDKNEVLQHKLSATEECLEQMRNDTKQTKERELHDLREAFKTENQQLRTQAAAEIERLKTEYHFLKADRDTFKTERDSLKAEKNFLETKIDSLRDERDSLQRQYTEAKAVAENFQYRLSKEFSIRLASDETNMENISVKHRPAKIAEKFAQIESKEWVEAKEILDDSYDDEKTSICLLLNMLKFACKSAQEVFDGFLSSEACRLYSPIAAITKTMLEDQAMLI